MRRQETTELVTKLMGLGAMAYGVIILALFAATTSIQPASQTDDVATMLWQAQSAQQTRLLVSGALLFSGGLLLIVFAKPISKRLGRDVSEQSGQLAFDLLSPRGFRSVVKLVGLYFLFLAIPSTAQFTSEIARSSYANPWEALESLYFFEMIGKLLVAFYLIRGGKWLTKFAWQNEPDFVDEAPSSRAEEAL